MNSYLKGKYKVVCFMRIDLKDDEEELDLRAAVKEMEQLKAMQPENIYQIERIHGTK